MHRLPCTFLSILISAAALLSISAGEAAAAITQRLKVSSNGRYLVQSNGTPFFWMGDTNWRLYKLTREEVDEYLDDRRAKNFNVIQGPVLLISATGDQFTSAYGDTNSDPDHPDAGWFSHIDYIVNAANQRNLYIALTVVWGDDWQAFPSASSARTFGRWLGNRYRNRANVLWIVAGEYCIEGFGSSIMNRWNSLGLGLKEGNGDTQLVTIHGSFQQGHQSSSIEFHNASWLDFNMIQSSQSGDFGAGSDNWNLIKTDWRKSPRKPTLDAEANYEQFGGWSPFGVRRRAYWSVFAGGFGHTYGANGVWSSYHTDEGGIEGSPNDPWNVAVDYAGAFDMKFLRRLMESRPMLNRAGANKTIVSGVGDGPTHIQATRDSAGRFLMVYVPQRDRQFTVNMDKVSGSVARAWWFDPRNGQTTLIGNYTSAGQRTFRTPNAGQDWVLVLDDKARNYPAPGSGGPLP